MSGLKEGIIVIMTGASTGIGRAMALELAKRYKAKLVINARTKTDLDETAKAIESHGGTAVSVVGDVSDKATVAAIAETCRTTYGTPDVLVNNAGLARPGAMSELSTEDWRYVFEVNFFSPLELTYAFLPDFIAAKRGKIVNIASVAGKVAFPGSVCYASSKFALTGFSEGMAAELGPKGIDVITVCPGLVRSEFFAKNRNSRDVTEMAAEKSAKGWLLRNLISISSEQAAAQIIAACQRGGCQEIVLTVPGQILERLAGICPPAAWQISRLVKVERKTQ